MKLDGISIADLQAKLYKFSDERFLELVRHSEILQRKTQDSAMLDALRPRLVQQKPPRAYTARRLLCLPFEDLLRDKGRSGEWGTRIARGAIYPVWDIIARDLDEDIKAGVIRQLAELPAGNTSLLEQIGADLFPAARTILNTWLDSPAADSKDATRAEPGSASLRDAVRDIADLLSLAKPLLKLKAVLSPAPVAKLSSGQIEAIRAIVDDIKGMTGRDAILFFSVAAARMAVPTDILDAVEKMAAEESHEQRKALMTGMSRAAYGDLDEACLRLTDAADQAQKASASRLAVIDEAVALARDVQAIRRVADRRKGTLPDGHLEPPVRAIAKVLLDVAVQDADAEIVQNLALALSRVDPETGLGELNEDGMDALMIEIEQRAVALRKCAEVAEPLGINRQVNQQRLKIINAVEEQTRTMISAVERGQITAEDRAVKETQLYNAVRTLELIDGPGRASQLLDQGSKAIQSAFR